MITHYSDYRVVYDRAGVRPTRWRNVEVAFIVDRPKEWGITDDELRDEADEIFRRFISETTFTTFPVDYVSGGFERSEESKVEPNTFKLKIEYSDYDYDKFFTREILIKDVKKLWDTEEHKAFWDELSRQISDIVTDEFMWGAKRPKGIGAGGRPRGG